MDTSEFRLREKTALIIGPLSRVHQALANRLTQQGADVVFCDQKVDLAQRFASQLMEASEVNDKFGRATAFAGEFTSTKSAQDAVSRAAECFGGVDILIDGTNQVVSRAFEQSVSEVDQVISHNLRGPLLAASAVLPFLKGRKKGRIIFLIDECIARGYAQASLFSAARTGLCGFASAFAREVADFQITVNCVSMGLTEEFLRSAFPAAASAQAALQEFRKQEPLAQMTDPEKISDTITFLVSPLGSGINGQTITVRQSAAGV